VGATTAPWQASNEAIMLSSIDRFAYHSQHVSLLIPAIVIDETARMVTRAPRPAISLGVLREIQRRRRALHAQDLANVDAGAYPRELLFDIPMGRYLRALPRLLRDAPNVVRRRRENAYQEVPAGLDRAQYPAYYRRTFHWQTDGYFSEHSAEIYELGVELLFRGTADVMRRQIIPPISELVRARGDASQLRVLDVACGTGRSLHQLARAHPTMQLTGVDLSPAYLEVARKRLRKAGAQHVTFVHANAEKLPFPDASFDAVSSVYLFHELPRNARRNVVREMLRVVKPGGVIVIEDSAQPSESPNLEHVLRGFPVDFHEPFYADYLEDDIAAMLAELGANVQSTAQALVAKVVIARAPAPGVSAARDSRS
jgi:ubiquinone/menaquinone biosynthesis C-methylase UbiE